MLGIQLEMDLARQKRLELRLDRQPVCARRHCRAGRDKIDLSHLIRRGNLVIRQKCNERRPVDTSVAPPVPRAGLFVIGEIGMELTQGLAHLPGLANRHIVVGIAVENVDAQPREVS